MSKREPLTGTTWETSNKSSGHVLLTYLEEPGAHNEAKALIHVSTFRPDLEGHVCIVDCNNRGFSKL